MNKQVLFEKCVNLSMKNDIERFFGKESYIIVENLYYVRSKKSYMTNIRLFMSDIEGGMVFLPDGLDMIVYNGWRIIDRKTPLIITQSIDSL
jgi:hypothetical protein